MRNWIRKALTRTEWIQRKGQKKLERVEVPPSERLILAIYLAIATLAVLTILEVIHMIFLGSFNEAIFSGIMSLIGSLIGILVGAKA